MSSQPPEYGIAPPLFEPPPRKPKGLWIALVLVALVVLGAGAFGNHLMYQLRRTYGPSAGNPVSSQETAEAPATRVVVFEVTGTGQAFSVTATVGVTVKTRTSVTLPWTETVEVPADSVSQSVMLVVVAGPDGAEVHGKYTIDGTTVREGKASVPYGVLTITDS